VTQIYLSANWTDSVFLKHYLVCYMLNAVLVCVQSCCVLQVYTSGKGSSAAGLTASVNRDPGSVSCAFLVALDFAVFLNVILSRKLTVFVPWLREFSSSICSRDTVLTIVSC